MKRDVTEKNMQQTQQHNSTRDHKGASRSRHSPGHSGGSPSASPEEKETPSGERESLRVREVSLGRAYDQESISTTVKVAEGKGEGAA